MVIQNFSPLKIKFFILKSLHNKILLIMFCVLFNSTDRSHMLSNVLLVFNTGSVCSTARIQTNNVFFWQKV